MDRDATSGISSFLPSAPAAAAGRRALFRRAVNRPATVDPQPLVDAAGELARDSKRRLPVSREIRTLEPQNIGARCPPATTYSGHLQLMGAQQLALMR